MLVISTHQYMTLDLLNASKISAAIIMFISHVIDLRGYLSEISGRILKSDLPTMVRTISPTTTFHLSILPIVQRLYSKLRTRERNTSPQDWLASSLYALGQLVLSR